MAGAVSVCLGLTSFSFWSQGRRSHVWSTAELVFQFSAPDGSGLARRALGKEVMKWLDD